MKTVIHQPQYFPYPGFFYKLSMADVFVIMDDTQYDKRWTIDWKAHHFKKIHQSYSRAPFFSLYKDYLSDLFKKDWDMLFDLDFETIKKVIEWLGMKIEIIRESELNVSGMKTERLVNVCKAIDADTYISGIGAKEYTNEKLFEQNHIKLIYQNYTPSPYPQRLSKSFIQDLSIIDLIANIGPNSLKLIEGEILAETIH